MKVFFHSRNHEQQSWRNESINFAQLPAIGDYVATSSDGPWYRIEVVVHTPFPCDFDAEAYAVEVDSVDVLNKSRCG